MAGSDYPPGRPLVILMGGPLHRRVYWRDEVPTRHRYRPAGRFTSKPLGDIYATVLPAGLRERLPEVWEWEPSPPAAAGFPHG